MIIAAVNRMTKKEDVIWKITIEDRL
jgi:hypothetical protein